MRCASELTWSGGGGGGLFGSGAADGDDLGTTENGVKEVKEE